jgi:dTMP kinase
MVKRGAFIVFEGIDGSGKSTHMRLLIDDLKRRGYDVLQTAEPTNGAIGAFIREYMGSATTRLSPEVEALLFAADRFEHVREVIEPGIERGQIVVSDRYLHSTLAYQGAAGLSLEWIREINRFAPAPDRCILLDVSPEMGLSRLGRRRRTVFEELAIQREVRRLYLDFVRRGEMVKVEAEGSVEEVQRQVSSIVMNLLQGTSKTVDRTT